MTPERAAVVEKLRAHLAQVAPVRSPPRGLPLGLPALDARTGGLPTAGVALVQGAPGSGRLGVLLPLLRSLTHDGRFVGIVDPEGWFYPPSLPDVRTDRLLVVRPGATSTGWALEQLARSGALPLVLGLDAPPSGIDRRISHAAEEGVCTVVLVADRTYAKLQPSLHVRMVAPGRVEVCRGGRPGLVAL